MTKVGKSAGRLKLEAAFLAHNPRITAEEVDNLSSFHLLFFVREGGRQDMASMIVRLIDAAKAEEYHSDYATQEIRDEVQTAIEALVERVL